MQPFDTAFGGTMVHRLEVGHMGSCPFGPPLEQPLVV